MSPTPEVILLNDLKNYELAINIGFGLFCYVLSTPAHCTARGILAHSIFLVVNDVFQICLNLLHTHTHTHARARRGREREGGKFSSGELVWISVYFVHVITYALFGGSPCTLQTKSQERRSNIVRAPICGLK